MGGAGGASAKLNLIPTSRGVIPVAQAVNCRRGGGEKLVKHKKIVKDADWHKNATACVPLLGGCVQLVVAFLKLAQFIDDCSN